jgi:predicted nucleotidyltransferase
MATFILNMRTHKSAGYGLVEVLFGRYRRHVLSLLLLHPDESFYVRQIARLTETPAGSLHRELKILTKARLLTRTISGNQVHYQADKTCPIFEDLAAIFRKTTGLADVLREALMPIASDVDLAFLFGSVAQGKERAGSDIDVMVTGGASFASVVEALNKAQPRLRRETKPVVMTVAEARIKHQGGDRFVSRIMQEAKLFLLGNANELGELVEDRASEGVFFRRRGKRAAVQGGNKESGRSRP